MKRTTLIIVLLAVMVVSCLALTACTHTHEFGDWIVTKRASCTEDGQQERYCSCGEKQTGTLAAIGHSYTLVVTNPNCTEGGFTTHTCGNCGDSYVDTNVQATGHSYTDVVIDPTCTAQGYTTHTCANCGDSYVDTYVDALGHTEGSVVIENNVAPQCTVEGSYDNVVYCNICKEELSRDTVVVPALGHTEGSVVVENNVDPTCTATGSYDNVVYCTVCKEELSRDTVVVPALGHTEGSVVVENNVDPTCTATGSYDNVVYCTVCKEELSRQTVTVDALGHDEVPHDAQEPTCTAIGWDAYVTCSHCDYTTYEEIPAKGHSYNSVVTESTCTEQGYATHTCRCGDSYVDTYTDATGHNFQESETCKYCGQNIADFSEGLVYELSDDRTSYIVTGGGSCYGNTDIVIPATYNGKPVKYIGDYSFDGFKLERITLPNTIISIGDYAFEDCKSLRGILIPNTTVSIGEGVFSGCTSLNSVTFMEGSILASIGQWAFSSCTSLKEIKIPDSVTTIEGYAFYSCTSLKDITIPSKVIRIEEATFVECASLKSVTLHSNIESIGSAAFNGCTSLANITIPSSVTSICGYAFRYCDSLTSVTFEDPNGWYCTWTEGSTSGIDLDLSDASQNATDLTDIYYNYYWYKNN